MPRPHHTSGRSSTGSPTSTQPPTLTGGLGGFVTLTIHYNPDNGFRPLWDALHLLATQADRLESNPHLRVNLDGDTHPEPLAHFAAFDGATIIIKWERS